MPRSLSRMLLGTLAVVLLWAAGPPLLHAQEVVQHPDPSASLDARWTWAEQQAAEQDVTGRYWIGYAIQHLMDEGSTMGVGSHSGRGGSMSLAERIYGDINADASSSVQDAAREALNRSQARSSSRKVLKDVALLYQIDAATGEVVEFAASNLSRSANLEERPLYWLGAAENDASVALAKRLYADANDTDLKENLTAAVGLHNAPALVVPFLQNVLDGSEGDDVRAAAAFWLGQQGTDAALATLIQTARSDRSSEVREKAVFAIHIIDQLAATDAIIDLARTARDDAVREQAVFWLGQQASEAAVAALDDIVYDETETEIQEKAVFAISQLPREESIPRLIKLAKTHPNPKIREKAIFWLGQTGDERAVDALVDIVRGG